MERLSTDPNLALLSPDELTSEEVAELLAPAGFADPMAAHRTLRQMAAGPGEKAALAGVVPHLLPALAAAAGPDAVLVSLQRFLQSVPDRLALLRQLGTQPRSLQILVTLFSGSQFLGEILLRHPDSFAQLSQPRQMAVRRSADELLAAARAALPDTGGFVAALDSLRRFQRLELLRIGACDLLGLYDLDTVTTQLSDLADALVGACLDVAERESGTSPEGFAVIAMGKLGGHELNYSSDIDLLFVALENAPSYWRLGERLIEALSRATSEGFLYRVDMRLRPWGEAGALVSSNDAYQAYMGRHARLWERQALLKARVVAGDPRAGNACLTRVAPLLFTTGAEAARREVRAMRQMTEREVRRKGLAFSEVKLGEGSIRDVEFVVQFLQLAHGGATPAVLSGNTRDALVRLRAEGILTGDEARVLSDGYVFLRTIEHHLQVMHYRQTHVLPSEPGALGELARRLGFVGEGAGERFRTRYREHGNAIRAIYTRHLGSDAMSTAVDARPSPSAEKTREHAARMDPSYAATFGEEEIRRHAALAGQLDDAHLVAVDATPLDDGLWRITIVGYDYAGELSLICGLLFANGFGIRGAEAFTYEPLEEDGKAEAAPPLLRLPTAEEPWGSRIRRRPLQARTGRPDARRKTVDVFTVSPVRGEPGTEVWERFAADLESFLRMLRSGERRAARGEIARRTAVGQAAAAGPLPPLYPVDIEIDNASSEKYTVLRIDAPDTNGFLYEFTNALALSGIYISRMTAGSEGSRVRDTLWVTDAAGGKITSPSRQRELRAATVLIKHFTHLLPRSPNPESALLHFGEFLSQLFAQPGWPDELASLESPKVLGALAQLLGVSDFLWFDFLRMQHANLFPIVKDVDEKALPKPKEALRAELAEAIARARAEAGPEGAAAAWRAALNALKDRELFRIDMRHILGRTSDIAGFGEELTDLAEAVVEAILGQCEEELTAVHGRPLLADGSVCPIAVCALGKSGGREMGFASDIELLFLYSGDGESDGGKPITTAEWFQKLVRTFIAAIRSKREGVFEFDLRLRPYGNAGSMAVTVDAFRRYYARNGPAWPYERQSLIRLRPVAGDAELGRRVVRLRDELVYDGEPPDVPAIRAMRERQIRQIVTGGTFNPKFSPGALVDVEYLVQALQIRHGHQDPTLRSPNTRQAMAALAAAGHLGEQEHERLRDAHAFLRRLVEALRVVRGNAKDVTIPPFASEEFAYLARRLAYGSDLARLRDEMGRAAATVQELSTRLLG